jgi:hypothetical protein
MNLDEYVKKLVATAIQEARSQGEENANLRKNGRWVKRRTLYEEGFTKEDLMKLEVKGLRKIKFEEESKNIFYDRSELDNLMLSMAR